MGLIGFSLLVLFRLQSLFLLLSWSRPRCFFYQCVLAGVNRSTWPWLDLVCHGLFEVSWLPWKVFCFSLVISSALETMSTEKCQRMSRTCPDLLLGRGLFQGFISTGSSHQARKEEPTWPLLLRCSITWYLGQFWALAIKKRKHVERDGL